MSAEALIQYNKWFNARNKHIEYRQSQWINNFGRRVDEREDGSSEDEILEEENLKYSEEEGESKQEEESG